MQLPMERITAGVTGMVPLLAQDREAAKLAAEAIMTTDTISKEAAATVEIGGKTVTVAGMCKGSGMIHPNMCTMLSFVTTDAVITKELLQEALSTDIQDTYNMISVDGDTSTTVSYTHLPTAVTNDCRAGLIGEKWKGSAAGYENVTGIILGTGVGGGVIDHHRILEGAFSGFGEIGHMILHPGGRLCTCGQRGCAEQYISGTALWQIYNERSGSASLSSGYEFFGRVQHNDGIALEVLKEFQLDLASCAVSCANLLDPEVILIGGGLADTADYWWDGFTAYCREIGNQHTQNQKLILAARGNDAALLGAARIAFDLYKTRHYQ